jgi:hypothetical protein
VLLRTGESAIIENVSEPAAREVYLMRRPGIVGPPAAMLCLMLLFVLGAPGMGQRLFYLGMAVLIGGWALRAWRVGVELTAKGITIRETWRTKRVPWGETARASTVPMRTMSPFAGRFPYRALALEHPDGTVSRFDDVSASTTGGAPVERLVSAINDRLRHG